MMTTTQKEAYNKTLAWVGFLVIFVGLPSLAIYELNAIAHYMADTAQFTYDQTVMLSEMRDALNCQTYHDRECDPFYQQVKPTEATQQ